MGDPEDKRREKEREMQRRKAAAQKDKARDDGDRKGPRPQNAKDGRIR